MPDISMCPALVCEDKDHCYRYTAIPSITWQAYFVADPPRVDNKCEFFWSNNDETPKSIEGPTHPGDTDAQLANV